MPTFTVGGTATIDEGEYPATLKAVEEGPEGKWGPTCRWVFDAYVEGEPEQIDMITGYKYSPKSNLKKVLDALLGHPLDTDEVPPEPEELIGKTCRLLVGINEGGYSAIESIKPTARKKAAA